MRSKRRAKRGFRGTKKLDRPRNIKNVIRREFEDGWVSVLWVSVPSEGKRVNGIIEKIEKDEDDELKIRVKFVPNETHPTLWEHPKAISKWFFIEEIDNHLEITSKN